MRPETITTRSFARDAAALIAAEARLAIAARGVFRLSLCGGNTPRPVYAALAGTDLPWEQIRITFGDERCVPPDSDQSNYRMAREALFDAVPLPEANILRMRGEAAPQEAADDYEARLAAEAAATGEPRYRHDVLLLGIGDDGHTASLFPGTTALEEQERNVVANFVPKLNTWRITFTYPLIDAARRVLFLVNDPKKEPIVQAILAGNREYPAGRVAPKLGRVAWVTPFGE